MVQLAIVDTLDSCDFEKSQAHVIRRIEECKIITIETVNKSYDDHLKIYTEICKQYLIW